jgi:hypothetical protein
MASVLGVWLVSFIVKEGGLRNEVVKCSDFDTFANVTCRKVSNIIKSLTYLLVNIVLFF